MMIIDLGTPQGWWSCFGGAGALLPDTGAVAGPQGPCPAGGMSGGGFAQKPQGRQKHWAVRSLGDCGGQTWAPLPYLPCPY